MSLGKRLSDPEAISSLPALNQQYSQDHGESAVENSEFNSGITNENGREDSTENIPKHCVNVHVESKMENIRKDTVQNCINRSRSDMVKWIHTSYIYTAHMTPSHLHCIH